MFICEGVWRHGAVSRAGRDGSPPRLGNIVEALRGSSSGGEAGMSAFRRAAEQGYAGETDGRNTSRVLAVVVRWPCSWHFRILMRPKSKINANKQRGNAAAERGPHASRGLARRQQCTSVYVARSSYVCTGRRKGSEMIGRH